VIFPDELSYATVSEFWTQAQFFEIIAPNEVAYVYKIKPALDFGAPLVSFISYTHLFAMFGDHGTL